VVRILALQNCAVEGFGRFQRVLDERGVSLSVVRPYLGDELPDLSAFDAVLVGGTPASALDIRDHAFLRTEAELLRRAVHTQVPCVGICFGAQILALLLGASVSRAPAMEIGTYPVDLTVAGSRDPLLAGFPERFPVFQWHADTFSIPPGGDLLAAGSPCPNQMFRHRGVVGVLFHLEFGPDDVSAFAEAYRDELAAFGRTGRELQEQLAPHVEGMARLADLFVANLLRTLR
jgi:GMP synthase-like glutamine amidotransferase